MSAFIFFLKQNQILNKCARKNLAKNPRAPEFFARCTKNYIFNNFTI